MSRVAKGTVLITDGDSRAALAVTRSLGRSGYRVLVGERRQPCLAGASRFCAGAVTYPDPAHDGSGFLEAVEQAIDRHGVDVLLPVADTATWLIVANRGRFDSKCLIPVASLDAVERAADKAWVVRRAAELGIPTPRTVFLEAPESLGRHRSELAFPLVIKPRRSKYRTADGWASARVSYASTWDELSRAITSLHHLEFPLLLQERITGPGVGIFTCIDRGVPLVWFSHRRLREKPPSGGVSVLCESIPVPDGSRNDAERLLRALDWQGVAMVEFKEDRRDGTWRLMEVNGRFWGSLQLAIDAGVDFPTLWLDRCLGHGGARTADVKVGIRSRWFWGDVDALLISLRRNGGVDDVGRSRRLLEFFNLWSPRLRYDNPQLSDMGPWWHESRAWLGNALP